MEGGPGRPGQPPSSANPAYQAKYRHLMERYGWTAEWLSEQLPGAAP